MLGILVGTVERVTFYNPENGYTVAQVASGGRAYTVTVVGNLPEVSPGENLRLVTEVKMIRFKQTTLRRAFSKYGSLLSHCPEECITNRSRPPAFRLSF
jgi:hypothetical protein